MQTQNMHINGTMKQVTTQTDCTGKTEIRINGRLAGWTGGGYTYGQDSRVLTHGENAIAIFAQAGL